MSVVRGAEYKNRPETLPEYLCTIARHGGRSAASAPRNVAPGQKLPGAINMGLADGHVELAKLENLWNYYWHRDWEPPATRPQ